MRMKFLWLAIVMMTWSGFAQANEIDKHTACLRAHKVLVRMFPKKLSAPKASRLRGCSDTVLAYTAATLGLMKKGSRIFRYVPTPKDVLDAAKSGSPAGVIRYFAEKYVVRAIRDLSGIDDDKIEGIIAISVKAGWRSCYSDSVRHIANGDRGIPGCISAMAKRAGM